MIHHGHSAEEAENTRGEIERLGRRINELTPLHGLVNSAAIFESLSLDTTVFERWQRHLQINLTAPFLLSQAFARQAPEGARIVNILVWRALRPGADHFPYTISKAALAAMTKSLAVALAPQSRSMGWRSVRSCHRPMEKPSQICSSTSLLAAGHRKRKLSKHYFSLSLAPHMLLARSFM